MEHIIRYHEGTDVDFNELPYSRDNLKEVIDMLSNNITGFSKIELWIDKRSDDDLFVWVELSNGSGMLGDENHQSVWLFRLNEIEEDWHNHIKEFQDIKRFLNRTYPNVKVTSNYR